MIKTILEEAVNGWVLTISYGVDKKVSIYEAFLEAQLHREGEEIRHRHKSLKEVKDHATSL
jgi:hypothetical protein